MKKVYLFLFFISSILLIFNCQSNLNNNCQSQLNKRIICFNNLEAYSITDTTILKPNFMDDMAICDEKIENYYLLSKKLPKAKINHKLKLNETVVERKAELEKWAWLKPDKLDLVLLSTLFECHSHEELIKYLTQIESKKVKLNEEIKLISNLFFSKTDSKYKFIQIRNADKKWLDENDISNSKSIIWITTYYKNSEVYGSEEYWIDLKKMRYQRLSDYWFSDFRGMTTPNYKQWKSIQTKNFSSKWDEDFFELLDYYKNRFNDL